MARVVTTEIMTKTALYITEPASAPTNTPDAPASSRPRWR